MWLEATQDFSRSVAAEQSCAVEIQPPIESSQSSRPGRADFDPPGNMIVQLLSRLGDAV
jgi:hypothetical protein